MSLDSDKIINFITKIGVPIRYQTIEEKTFLEGLKIDKGTLIIDKNRLPYIGDALHEAGHIALMKPDDRENLTGDLEGQQDSEAIEMAVIAWTYAACLEIGINPSVVFHEDGYKGASESIIQNFKEGSYLCS